MIFRFPAVTIFGGEGVQWKQRAPAAALQRLCAGPLLGQEMLQSRQEKRAKLAFRAVNVAQIILLQEPHEELLRQILGIVRAVALPADEGVKRIPIDLA